MKTNLKARYEAPAALVLEISTKASVMIASQNQATTPGYGNAKELDSMSDYLF